MDQTETTDWKILMIKAFQNLKDQYEGKVPQDALYQEIRKAARSPRMSML
jgi:hypothetical protein